MPERRQSPRAAPKKSIYIGFGTNNGGIVSDVSVTGLGFCAVAPVPSSGMISFWFLRQPNSHIEAVGEIVWRDETRKRGGLRFTLLPMEAWQALGITQATTLAMGDVVDNCRTEVNLPKTNSQPTASAVVTSDQRCPQCGSANIRKLHRNTIWERYVLSVVRLRPYRCIDCYCRFIAEHPPTNDHDMPAGARKGLLLLSKKLLAERKKKSS